MQLVWRKLPKNKAPFQVQAMRETFKNVKKSTSRGYFIVIQNSASKRTFLLHFNTHSGTSFP